MQLRCMAGVGDGMFMLGEDVGSGVSSNLFIADAHRHVFGQIDQDRAGPATGGYRKGLVDHPRELAHVLHQVIPFGARARDPGDVGFLKGVVSDHLGRNLAPLKTMIGTESICAVARGVTQLVAAGPLVTTQIPGLPVTRAYPSGANARSLLMAIENKLGGCVIQFVEHRQDAPPG